MTDEPEEPVNPYLWDRSGEPDPLVAALERKLAPLASTSRPAMRPLTPIRRPWRSVALVAALALLTAVPFYFLNRAGTPSSVSSGFELALRSGAARVMTMDAVETSLPPDMIQRFPLGSTLVCDAGASVTLRVGQDQSGLDLGEVEIEGPSTLRLDASSEELKRLFLQRGTVRARISARAKQRLFQVGTPVGNAVDLGCAYTMTVKDDHTALLRVQLGRVAFEVGPRSVYVWAGARCSVDRDRGAGLPVDEGAETAFVKAAESWTVAVDKSQRFRALLDMGQAARLDDAATLWHVVVNCPTDERAHAVEQLEALSPRPATVPRESAVKGDSDTLESWRVHIMGW